MAGTAIKLDANESVFFNRELEHVKARTYDAKLKELKALSLIPISTDAGEGATEITFRRYNAVGIAKVVADYAKDFPRVDVYGEEESVKIKSLGSSYGYSIKEIRSSQMAGKSLDVRRATAARRAHDEAINRMALYSDPANGTRGILDYEGITEVALPADGTGNSRRWEDKDADQIIRDVNTIVDAIMLPTYGREAPNTLLLPLNLYNLIANIRLSNTDKNLMGYILQNNPHIQRIDYLLELSGAGAGGTDRILAGTFDEEHITLEIPHAFEQFEPQQEGMEFTIPCHSECAGVIVYYPLAFAYADGV